MAPNTKSGGSDVVVMMFVFYGVVVIYCHVTCSYIFQGENLILGQPENRKTFFFKVLRIPKSSLKILTLHMDEPLISYVEGLNAAGMDSLLITPVSQVWKSLKFAVQIRKVMPRLEMFGMGGNELLMVEANARQRSGRAGRTGPGKCYRGKLRVVVADWDRSCFRSKLCKIV